MTKDPYEGLSRRERQIMMILYRQGSATAEEVQRLRQCNPHKCRRICSSESLCPTLEHDGDCVRLPLSAACCLLAAAQATDAQDVSHIRPGHPLLDPSVLAAGTGGPAPAWAITYDAGHPSGTT